MVIIVMLLHNQIPQPLCCILLLALLVAKNNAQTNPCFTSKLQLKTAVDSYISEDCSGNPACATGLAWGWPIGTWCTSLVTDMSNLFQGHEWFNEDISGWNVSSVTNMGYMFYEVYNFNADISGWDVGSVTNMNTMFSGYGVGDLPGMPFNQDISGWNVSSVTNMGHMFAGARSFNQDISGWNVGSVTNMESMFKKALSFNADISGWNVGSVTNMGQMFYWAPSFNTNISGWNVGLVTNMKQMFFLAYSFNVNISGWNVGLVTNMEFMFCDATAFNADISGWNVDSVTNMNAMFYGATSFNQSMCAWKETILSISKDDIFDESGCTHPSTPFLSSDPFCAVASCPSAPPTATPSTTPTVVPTNSSAPTATPSASPTALPSIAPTTASPSRAPAAATLITPHTASFTPTKSPIFLTLPFVGACPIELNESVISYFEPGDRVSKNAIVFECKSWPNSLFCSQSSFTPSLNSKSEAWKQAWEVVGLCTRIITTPSSVDGCPDLWSPGDPFNKKYKENDLVSVIKSTLPRTQGIYKCKAWPYSLYCGQHSPLDYNGGKLGWLYIGQCAGTISPSTSPTLSPATVIIAGCPSDYNYNTANKYMSGDRVAVTMGDSSLYKNVYVCREFPYSGYCNLMGFSPGEQYDYMAWTLLGPCDGTLAPTTAPTAYTGGTSCTYIKMDTTALTPTAVIIPVAPWSAGTQYVGGDQVRIGAKKFQCKPSPFYLWCRMPAYAPTLVETGLWTEAWTVAGTCS